jgi:hypothetical protein
MLPAMADDAKAKPKAHPLRGTMWFLVLMACAWLVSLVISGTTFEIGNLPFLGFIVAMVVSALRLRAATVSVPQINTALDAHARADLAEARALLEQADQAASRSPYLMRAIDLQRAEIAWTLGDLNAARAFVELAAKRPARGAATRLQEGSAWGLSALVRAARGELDQARLDIERMRTHPSPLPGALGRAELAQAIVLARTGDRAALESHLERRREILRQVAPRERAIARVLERFALGGNLRVMHAAPLARACGEIPSLSTWLAKVLPIDLPLAKEPEGAMPPMQPMKDAPPARLGDLPDRSLPVPPAKGRAARSPVRAVVLWAVLILMFLAIWQFLNSGRPTRPASAQPDVPVEEAR